MTLLIIAVINTEIQYAGDAAPLGSNTPLGSQQSLKTRRRSGVAGIAPTKEAREAFFSLNQQPTANNRPASADHGELLVYEI